MQRLYILQKVKRRILLICGINCMCNLAWPAINTLGWGSGVWWDGFFIWLIGCVVFSIIIRVQRYKAVFASSSSLLIKLYPVFSIMLLIMGGVFLFYIESLPESIMLLCFWLLVAFMVINYFLPFIIFIMGLVSKTPSSKRKRRLQHVSLLA